MVSPKNKFKTPQGVLYLRGLFFEETGADKSTCVYTLKDEDHMGFPSLYRIYMEMEDPTEWRFANEALDGWKHWQSLCEASWFQKYLNRWREELELKMKGRALVEIQATASNPDSKNHYNANRFLLEGGWKDKPSGKRGRPSKEEIKNEAHRQISREVEDLKRIRLNA